MQWDRKTDSGSIGVLKTASGCIVTTWSRKGSPQASMPLTNSDVRALREMLALAESAGPPNGEASGESK